MSHRTGNGDQEVRGLAAWNRMTVKALYFVLRCGGVIQQVSDAVYACEWVAIPSDCGRRTIEFWQVYGPRWRVVRGIIEASELVRSTGGDFDVISSEGAHPLGVSRPKSWDLSGRM